MPLSRLVAAAALAVPAFAEQASPIGKAVQLLGDLQAKIIREGEEAQKVYGEFAEWCEDRSANLQHEIKTAKGEITDLTAVAEKQTATVGSLGTKVEKLAGDIATDEADLKAATVVRQKEHKAFAAEEKELMEVVDTLRRAVGILEREMKGGAALVQLAGARSVVQAMDTLVQAAMLSTADAGRLQSFLQSSSEDEQPGAPAAATYESHSGDIVQTIADLLDKAEEQLDAARQSETKNLHAYELLEQSLNDEMKFSNKELADAKSGIASASEKKATAEGDLQVTQKDLSTDAASLSELHHECMTKAQDFESETKSRGDELKALAAAKKAITENTGGADSQTYDSAASLLQTAARAGTGDVKVAHLVRELARRHGSRDLVLLAQRVGSVVQASAQSGADGFGKVKGLIQDMIEKLEQQAEADATKKAYCDKELAETNANKDEKTTDLEKLSTQIEQATAHSARLKEQAADLAKALSALATAQAGMDKIRAEEKELYGKSKAEMEQGLRGVQTALKVLNDYYGGGDQSHAAAEGAGAGIVGLLEVVESDFSKGLAEITAAEETAQSSYDAETKENEIEKAAKSQDVKYKSKESTELDKTAAELKSDHSSTQAELDAVHEYLTKVEAECVAKAETFEDRKARFEAELAGLKEALRVLDEEAASSALIQRRSTTKQLRGVRRHTA